MKRPAAALMAAVVLLLPSAAAAQTEDTVTICHATGGAVRPYEQLVLSLDEPSPHFDHEDDLIPAPPGGCPTRADGVDVEPLAICHATRDPAHPYETFVVAADDVEGHDAHPDDLIPAPPEGCPGDDSVAAEPPPTVTSTPRPARTPRPRVAPRRGTDPGAAGGVRPAVVQAAPATGTATAAGTLAGLPLTGTEVWLTAGFGAGFLLTGAGLALLSRPRSA